LQCGCFEESEQACVVAFIGNKHHQWQQILVTVPSIHHSEPDLSLFFLPSVFETHPTSKHTLVVYIPYILINYDFA